MGRLGVGRRVLAATAACAVAVGCGGGSGGPKDAKTIPKAQFIRRADELCARADRRTERLPVPPLPPRASRQLDEIAAFFRAQVAIGSRELAQIRRLGVAVPGTAAQTENLDTVDALIAEMRAIVYHARRAHLDRTRARYRRVQAISERATDLAMRFGYDVCGQSGVHRVLNR
jgi:hypothetical protein